MDHPSCVSSVKDEWLAISLLHRDNGVWMELLIKRLTLVYFFPKNSPNATTHFALSNIDHDIFLLVCLFCLFVCFMFVCLFFFLNANLEKKMETEETFEHNGYIEADLNLNQGK